MRNTPSGTGAFAPATLPAATVQGLLGGGRVDALADGIRVRRATNTDGTAYQEMRINASNRANWTWTIGGGVLFSSIIVDGTSYPAGNTQSWARNSSEQNLLRMTTTEIAAHNYKAGFAYGNKIVRPEQPHQLPVAVRQREVRAALRPGVPAAEADHGRLRADSRRGAAGQHGAPDGLLDHLAHHSLGGHRHPRRAQ